ncbi:piggyBac transposable element-derived protein 4-like [Phymastichus coffea]|uniref:piggyBac transposable element-derived protein 4-like n=1 Tax=Phymastichus coffea TaxID=108790 RepID=UPI00273B8C7A|nr:piggyBac transposable element-derived protein 4-like [Phymastichus coffea]
MSLSQTLKNKNYHIYFSNYFTSTNLMITLLKDGISACWTIRKDRKGLTKNQGKDKDMKMGGNEYRTSNDGIRYLKWVDKKPIHFLSNFHDPSDLSEVERRQKDGSLKTIACPQMSKDYNAHMGCLDKSDQMKSFYEITRKSRKWWHCLLWHFIDVTLVNSFIIFKLLNPDKDLKSKEFRLLVVDELIGLNCQKKRGRPYSNNPKTPASKKIKTPESIRTSGQKHLPGVYEGLYQNCEFCSTKNNRLRSQFYCITCNVTLCIKSKKNCFAEYHK